VTDGRDGLLLPPRAPGAWATALEQVIGDARLRDALARAGRRRAADFSPDRHVAAVLAAYDASARAPRRPTHPDMVR